MQKSAMASGNAIDLPAKLSMVLHNVVSVATRVNKYFAVTIS